MQIKRSEPFKDIEKVYILKEFVLNNLTTKNQLQVFGDEDLTVLYTLLILGSIPVKYDKVLKALSEGLDSHDVAEQTKLPIEVIEKLNSPGSIKSVASDYTKSKFMPARIQYSNMEKKLRAAGYSPAQIACLLDKHVPEKADLAKSKKCEPLAQIFPDLFLKILTRHYEGRSEDDIAAMFGVPKKFVEACIKEEQQIDSSNATRDLCYKISLGIATVTAIGASIYIALKLTPEERAGIQKNLKQVRDKAATLAVDAYKKNPTIKKLVEDIKVNGVTNAGGWSHG